MRTLTKPKVLSEVNSSAIKQYLNRIICGDSLKTLQKFPSESVDCVVTSPPYWRLRDYGVKGQIGLEPSIEEYLEKLLAVFDEVKQVLKPSGTCWVNFGDNYANKTRRVRLSNLNPQITIPPKSLCLIPSRFALKMVERGWILRNEIIWHKPNAMPQSVKDRFSVDFEKLFFFVKERKYYFKQQFEPLNNPRELKRKFSNPFENHSYLKLQKRTPKSLAAIRQAQAKMLKRGRKKRCVWQVGTGASNNGHFAIFPPRLVETPILAGCPEGGIVLDPFVGSGTTAVVAKKLGRSYIGIELNKNYVKIAKQKLAGISSENKTYDKQIKLATSFSN